MARRVGTLAGNLHFNARRLQWKVGEGSELHRALSALLPSPLSFSAPPINTLCYDVGLWSRPRGGRERRAQWFTLHRSDGQIEMMLWTHHDEEHVISYCLFDMVSVYSVSIVLFCFVFYGGVHRSSLCLLCKKYDLSRLRKTPGLGCWEENGDWWLGSSSLISAVTQLLSKYLVVFGQL